MNSLHQFEKPLPLTPILSITPTHLFPGTPPTTLFSATYTLRKKHTGVYPQKRTQSETRRPCPSKPHLTPSSSPINPPATHAHPPSVTLNPTNFTGNKFPQTASDLLHTKMSARETHVANRLEGKVAAITGGDQGIGRGIVERFAADGADIALCYRSNKSGAEEVVAAVQKLGRKAAAFQADVGKVDQGQKFINDAVAALGRIDILVNNAGLERRADFWDVPKPTTISSST